MAARPRKREYRHLPEYLIFDKDRGVYKFTLITGKKKNLGKDRAMAIAIAREYNLRMRPFNAPSVELLIRDSGGIAGEAKPFAEHVDHIMDRVIENERPSQNTLDDWSNDVLRVKEFFASMPACDIELEHVNAYINHYHADASANVQK
uniref:phage integrase Arm DNA-binding domain-containing protein n=1 Tax=Klebsiella pneumoniae TaxID=573 RepID=UPI003889444B